MNLMSIRVSVFIFLSNCTLKNKSESTSQKLWGTLDLNLDLLGRLSHCWHIHISIKTQTRRVSVQRLQYRHGYLSQHSQYPERPIAQLG